MSTINEALSSLPPGQTPPGSGGIYDALSAGVDILGQHETVTFVPYIRTVLPVDGFVFWLNASLYTPQQRAAHGLPSPDPITVEGSLHYSSQAVMAPDETIVVRSVDFTSKVEVEAFGALDNDTMYVGTWPTPLGSFQITFSRRNPFYVQAGISHYVGDAVYPAFAAQLIDDLSGFDQRQVVSNSLPIWLAMVQSPPIFSTLSSPLSTLYPAYLVPDNLIPAYGVVEIPSNSTRALQAVAWRDRNSSRWQLVTERVKITTYGLRNDEISDLLDYALDYSAATGNFGLMSAPVIRDEYRPQVELAALAQKKNLEFEISYNQQRARDVARQVIKNAIMTPIISDDPAFPYPPLLIDDARATAPGQAQPLPIGYTGARYSSYIGGYTTGISSIGGAPTR